MRRYVRNDRVMSTGDQWIDRGAYGNVLSEDNSESVLVSWNPHPDGMRPKLKISLFHRALDLVLSGTAGDPNFEFRRRKQT